MASIPRTTRACDGCRFRKVKCNGADPCSQCAHLALKCTTSSVPRKRTVGARGRLVEQLRKGGPGKALTAQPPASSISPANHNGASTDGTSPNGESITSNDVTSPKTPVPGRSPFSQEFFTSLLPDFDEIVYPMNPTITNQEMRAAIENMHNSFEDAALVYAFGAVTVNLGQTSMEVHKTLPELMELCLQAHTRAAIGSVRGGGILGELPVSLKRAVTCIYLEICTMAYKLYDRSFALLREAISMVQVMQVHAKSLSQFSPDRRESFRWQRLYWELFIHERFTAITAGHSPILHPLPGGPPTGDDSIPIHVEVGFNRIISLFCILDHRFLDLWKSQTASLPCVAPVTPEWIEAKQTELDNDELDVAASQRKMAMDGHEPLNELQLADLWVTRHWMRTLVWQIALSCGHLRSDAAQTGHEGLSLDFPVQRLSHDIRSLVSRLDSVASIGTHGSGILEKLFEITSTIADVLALPMAQSKTQHEAHSRMEDFEFLVQFMFGFQRIDAQQKAFLEEKLEGLRRNHDMLNFGC